MEVAGLVLAILPIAIKATKNCAEGVDDGKKILLAEKHKELKRDLYSDLYQELVLFHRHIQKVLQALPDLSEQRCNQILDTLDQQDWQLQSDVVQALKKYLGNDFEHFDHAIAQVHSWIDEILEDRSFKRRYITKDDGIILNDLKLLTDKGRPIIESAFRDRLHLWRKEEKLKEQIKKLKKWRKFVERITENTQCKQHIRATADAAAGNHVRPRPSSSLPQISTSLYRALSQAWKCNDLCPATHQAKLCLHTNDDLHTKPDPECIRYKLIVSTPHAVGPSVEQWRETKIDVRCVGKQGKVSFTQTVTQQPQLKNMCETILQHQSRRGNKLCFTAEHFDDGNIVVYRTKDYIKSHFDFEAGAKQVTLKDSLAILTSQLDLSQKRRLALSLAYGMLTMAGSPWLEERWSKDHISFFCNNCSQVCHIHPFLSSDMKRGPSQTPPSDLFHPLPSIVSLGIVLLELETGQAIESMRTDNDYFDASSKIADDNTDFFAAIREAETRPMTSPLYKEAILACLDEQDWDDGRGIDATIAHEHVRKRIYDRIIQKLEADLEPIP